MERSRNFYKTIRLGYILISVLIGCIAYNSFYEWQEIEALELDNLNIDIVYLFSELVYFFIGIHL